MPFGKRVLAETPTGIPGSGVTRESLGAPKMRHLRLILYNRSLYLLKAYGRAWKKQPMFAFCLSRQLKPPKGSAEPGETSPYPSGHCGNGGVFFNK
jgi:hypothetical protein